MSILETLRPAANLRVLVTAGARGSGAAVARALHAAGAHVHVCDVDRAALDRLAAGTRGLTTSMADVSVPADVDQVFDDVKGVLGGLDVLVSHAGSAGPAGPIEHIDRAGWERTVAVNLDSQYYVARRAVPLLRRSAHGATLIAVGASAGDRSAHERAPCASTRWALVGLVRSLAAELGPQGMRVNAILPCTGDAAPHATRCTTADDVAAMALFLCSPAARSVTGQAIAVGGDAGWL